MSANNQHISDFKQVSTFQGLNALRFIAAFLVVIHHGETIKKKNGIEDFEWLGLFRNGGNAVTFFFVLSGFLITYLLLKENGNTGRVRIRRFYLKRVLRIWPLYFLLVFIGTIGLPIIFPLLQVSYEMPYTLGQSWFYFVFFVPGLVTFYYGHHLLEPLWSIGVEEVFYLFWAPLFKVSRNSVLVLIAAVILVELVLRFSGIFFIQSELYDYLVHTFQFDAMAIGGLGAYFLYTKGPLLIRCAIFKVPFQVAIISLLLIFLVFHANIDYPFWNFFFKTSILSNFIMYFLFLYLIICVSVIDNSVLKLRYSVLSYLGTISYGIYMYHMLVIFATILFMKEYLARLDPILCLLVFYGVTIILTVLVARLSKYLFENYFLNFKGKLDKSR